jgi:hypothetical protein
VADEPRHVVHQLADAVVFDARGLVAQVVAAQVGRDDVETLAERGELVTPRVPEFGEAVQQQDERVARLARLRVVQPHVAHLRVAAPDSPLGAE